MPRHIGGAQKKIKIKNFGKALYASIFFLSFPYPLIYFFFQKIEFFGKSHGVEEGEGRWIRKKESQSLIKSLEFVYLILNLRSLFKIIFIYCLVGGLN